MGKLTDSKIKALKPREKPYKATDGDGLRLHVYPTGSKLWQLKYHLNGDENTASFGAYPAVGLAHAREEAKAARALVARGIHPREERKRQEAERLAAQRNAFGVVATEWMDANKSTWAPYTYSQVKATIDRYVIANPRLSAMPVRDVQAKDIRELLQSVARRTSLGPGERKAEGAVTVARNLRSWCRNVFEFAMERDLTDRDPTSSLRNLTELRRPTGAIRHNKKLSPAELKEVLTGLAAFSGTRQVGIAIELLMLFFVRTAELRCARWEEFDLKAREWRIPAARMKASREHVVPIASQALSLLLEQQTISGKTGWVFPNQRTEGQCMSATTVNRALERMGFNGAGSMGLAAHGFRGTASTLLHEAGFNSDVVEMQLAHTPRNAVKAAYNAAEHIPKRVLMMQAWADYIDAVRANNDGADKVLKSAV
jgi:integrase